MPAAQPCSADRDSRGKLASPAARWPRRTFAAALLLAALSGWCAAADHDGPVVLIITGKLQRSDGKTQVSYDMATLARFKQYSYTTHTPWYQSARQFTGPLLRDVLADAGANGSTLRATALNDYRVTLPVEDTLKYEVLVARLIDGRAISVRDKGPLFIIYPFDANEELRNVVHYSRSAWQLKTIEVQ